MKKIIVFFAFWVGCSSVYIQSSQSCDLCGNWSFDKFEYVGHITTDCASTAKHFYKNTSIKIDINNAAGGKYDSEEKAQELFVKTKENLTEKFYVLSQDSIYVFSDGCRFYFKRK